MLKDLMHAIFNEDVEEDDEEEVVEEPAKQEEVTPEPVVAEPQVQEEEVVKSEPILKEAASSIETDQPVISPIFGNVEDSEKEFDKVHDAITLNKPEDEDFSKILSPMYGTYLPSMQPADSIPEYKVEESKKNMNLSEMLEKPKKETNKQESLFDKEGE
ncbi:hypothetical protein [Holdemanella porci]|uniref:hypothetical protein n=1 Tax=Holdemanella porci TaxID=2652276 RepID=UPI003FD6EB48